MNWKWPFVVCWVISSMMLSAQYSSEELRKFIENEECHQLVEVLDTMVLSSDDQTYFAAICHFKNANYNQSVELFTGIHQEGSRRFHNITYWLTRSYLGLGEKDKAKTLLLSIPVGNLSVKMISIPDFQPFEGQTFFDSIKRQVFPSFGIWTSILLGISILGFLLSGLFLIRKNQYSKGQRWMALTMFSFAIILLSYIFIWTRYSSTFPYLNNTWQFFTYLIGPSIYFYLHQIFEVQVNGKKILKHLLFPLLMGLLMLPLVLTNFGVSLHLSLDLFTIGSSSILMIAHLLYYSFRIHNIIKNDWQVDSNIERWSKIVANGFTIYSIAFISYFVLAPTSFFNPQWDYAISLAMAISILTVAYMGLLQKKIFASESMDNFLPISKYKSSTLTESSSKSIMVKMGQLLNEEKVFKENELRLDDLAEYLNINRHQLSQVINENFGVNFFELINSFRVEHVKMMLAKPENSNLTISQIAFESGFNNKASFNRYFKNSVGLTPSAFRLKFNNENVI